MNCLFASGENVTVNFFKKIWVTNSLGSRSLDLTIIFLKMHLFGKPGLGVIISGSVQGREGRGRVGKWNQPGCSALLPSLQSRAWK